VQEEATDELGAHYLKVALTRGRKSIYQNVTHDIALQAD
jgi:hypothetical protein